jgi:glycosyltransferase involved in cell wall biosynthesis
MKKKILISSYDMEVGGVERSLISLLENLDYDKYDIDLMLFRHQGDFMNLLPPTPNLLPEIPEYTTFRKSIGETIKEKHLKIGISRILSKFNAALYQKVKRVNEPGYYQMQLMWKYALPFLPKLNKEYDIAISYLWPHYFVVDKVVAKKKIAWIHTDYSTVDTNIRLDLKMWNRFDHLIAVSDACKSSFVKKYSKLESKVKVIENITSQEFIRKMSNEISENPMAEDNRFKILTVARLSHAKGIDNAVEALKKLREKGIQDIAWYIIGYGGDESAIKQLIIDNNLESSFILLGKKTNPYPFIKECDLYVQPSRYEGKAVTVTEAKILGKPILITNYPTANSQIINGIDGYICEIGVEGLANGIEKLYNNQELRSNLIKKIKDQDFNNRDELANLYHLIG